MTSIDQHEQKVSSIQSSLEDLKRETLSDAEKQQKAAEIKRQAEAEKVSVEQRINELEDRTDVESIKEKEKAQTQLDTLNDIINVQLSVLSWKVEWSNTSNSPEISATAKEQTSSETWKEDTNESDKKKWFWKWLKEHWKWLSLWTLWLWWLLWWRKKKKQEKESEEEDYEEWEETESSKKSSKKKRKKKEKKEKSWFKKFLIWAWITTWTVVWWVEIYKHWNKIKWWFKELLWLNLSFEEAKAKVEAEVRNWINSDNKLWTFYAHFEWIDYIEGSQMVSSYWEETKIDYKNKKIDWLNVEFPDREQLLHAANLVNFAKRKLKWRWSSETPFTVNQRWDISFGLSGEWQTSFISWSDSNLWKLILWWTWVVGWWLLGWYCTWIKWAAIWALAWWATWYVWWAILDENSSLRKMCDTIKKWSNLSLFVNYLNIQKDVDWKSLRTPHDHWPEAEDKNPIQVYVEKVKEEIKASYWNWERDGSRRNLQVEFNENTLDTFIVTSYGQPPVQLTLEWCEAKQWDVWIDFTKIKKIHIEKYNESDWWDWLDLDFPHTEEWLKEAIRTINLTNKIREDRNHRWWDDYPFYWWKYSTPPCLDFNSKWFRWHTILSRNVAKEKFPTLFKDLKKWENWGLRAAFDIDTSKYQEKMHNQSYSDLNEWSQYIKYLHQMRDGNNGYWKKDQK